MLDFDRKAELAGTGSEAPSGVAGPQLRDGGIVVVDVEGRSSVLVVGADLRRTGYSGNESRVARIQRLVQ